MGDAENRERPRARTIKELTVPDLTQVPLCISFPALAENATFELKSRLIHQLPQLYGTSTEDPTKHLNKFHVVCSSTKPNEVINEQLQLRAFPFSLKDAANDWLYYLPTGSITTWNHMKKAFLQKYFPANDARMIKAATQGGIKYMSVQEANDLIERLVESSRNFGRRIKKAGVASSSKKNSTHMEDKIDFLTNLVKDLSKGVEDIAEDEIEVVVDHKRASTPKKLRIDEPHPEYEPQATFPNALNDTMVMDKKTSSLYKFFRKVEVNIPLIDHLSSVPKHAELLKELCTIKRINKAKSMKKVRASEHVSAVFQKRLPKKCGDPGMFTIPCKIGESECQRAMLDSGASINVLPHYLYESLKLGPLKPIHVVISLADGSNIYPKGIIEDVLV
ncbi:uncharacterized protein LOC141607933 [Silene latifolia]|uniref:uncharacterized protein LOC141607933 n=1 Tax=Silene latifolia TaxID=37657 RepID=UPI003D76EBD9